MASVSKTADDGKKTDGPKKTADAKTGHAGAGYHYFHEQANRGTAPKAQPVKLSEAEAAALSAKLEGSGGSGLSSWNTAGTWEERTHTKWAEARVAELLKGKAIVESDAMRIALTGVKSFEGDATVVMVRGKPRHGFDFALTLTFECVVTTPKDDETETDEPRTIKGAVKIPEASRDTVDDDDMSFVVDVEDRAPERRGARGPAAVVVAMRSDGALQRLHACSQFLVARERRRHAVRVEPRRLARALDRRVRVEVVGTVRREFLDQCGHFSHV